MAPQKFKALMWAVYHEETGIPCDGSGNDPWIYAEQERATNVARLAGPQWSVVRVMVTVNPVEAQ